jgi:lysozyme
MTASGRDDRHVVVPRRSTTDPPRCTLREVRSVVATRWTALAALAALVGAAVAACSTGPQGACVGDTSQAVRVCAGPATVRGVDVSSYQRTVDFARVKGDGRQFVIVRVTAGTNVDTQFATNWPAAKRAGLVRGGYQYFYPSQDVDRQADLMIAQLKGAGYTEDDLPPVLDIETSDGLPAATVVARGKRWLARVEAGLAVRPMVYTAAFMSGVLGTNFSGYPLWVANYGVTCPELPAGWTKWVAWQDSSTGRVAGVTGNVDTDVWNGTLAELMAFARASHVRPPTDAGAGDASARDAEAGAPGREAGTDAPPPPGAPAVPSGPASPPPSPDPCAPPAAP